MLVLPSRLTGALFVAPNFGLGLQVRRRSAGYVIGFVLRFCRRVGTALLRGPQILEAFVKISFGAVAGGGYSFEGRIV